MSSIRNININNTGNIATPPSNGYTTPDEDGYTTPTDECDDDDPSIPDPNVRHTNDRCYPLPSMQRLGHFFENGKWKRHHHYRSLTRSVRCGNAFKTARQEPCSLDRLIIILVHGIGVTSDNITEPREFVGETTFLTKTGYFTSDDRLRYITMLLCCKRLSIYIPQDILWYIRHNFHQNAIYHIVRYNEEFVKQSNGTWLGIPRINARLFEIMADDEEDTVPWKIRNQSIN